MKEYMYRICWTCWIFGLLLAVLSFMIAFEETQFFFIGLCFVAIHIIGFVGKMKHIKDNLVG